MKIDKHPRQTGKIRERCIDNKGGEVTSTKDRVKTVLIYFNPKVVSPLCRVRKGQQEE